METPKIIDAREDGAGLYFDVVTMDTRQMDRTPKEVIAHLFMEYKDCQPNIATGLVAFLGVRLRGISAFEPDFNIPGVTFHKYPGSTLQAEPRKGMTVATALDRQTGGTHYKTLPIQPVEFSMAQMYDFCTASILKYVSRHRQKNGRQDIEKAIHFAELRAEVIQKHDLERLLDASKAVRQVSGLTWVCDAEDTNGDDMGVYIRVNGFTGKDAVALRALDSWFRRTDDDGLFHLRRCLRILSDEYDSASAN